MSKKNKILLVFVLAIVSISFFVSDIIKSVLAVNLVAVRYAFNAVCPTISGLTLRGATGTYGDGVDYVAADCTSNGAPKCICFYSEI